MRRITCLAMMLIIPTYFALSGCASTQHMGTAVELAGIIKDCENLQDLKIKAVLPSKYASGGTDDEHDFVKFEGINDKGEFSILFKGIIYQGLVKK